jgi:hypothetical protein
MIENYEQQRRDAERALVALKNYNELIRLMGQHGILIPAKRLPLWRPTVQTKGDIDGVHEALTILATDGLLGWYLTSDGQTWCGHIQCFSGKIEPRFRIPKDEKSKPKKPKRPKSRRREIIDSL